MPSVVVALFYENSLFLRILQSWRGYPCPTDTFLVFFKKNHWLAIKRIQYLCEGGVTKPVHQDHSKSLVMPNGDPRDGVFYPTLALMRDS